MSTANSPTNESVVSNGSSNQKTPNTPRYTKDWWKEHVRRLYFHPHGMPRLVCGWLQYITFLDIEKLDHLLAVYGERLLLSSLEL
jgi:hypothetical protein